MKPKLFNLRLLASLFNLKYLEISENDQIAENKFWSIFCEVLSITAKFFLLRGLISIIYHQIKNSKRHNEQVFNKTAVLKNFAIFTEKQLCWNLFLNKNAGLQSWNFIKRRLQHRFFPVNIAKFLRTPVLENICERRFERFPTWASNIASNMGIEEHIFSETKHGNWRGHFPKK